MAAVSPDRLNSLIKTFINQGFVFALKPFLVKTYEAAVPGVPQNLINRRFAPSPIGSWVPTSLM
jgi:hypothetical protein